MIIQVPVTTEVIEKNASLQPNGKVEDKRIIIEIDTRKRDYHKLFNLKRKVTIGWINETTFDVQELSGFYWPIVYRITTATGYYADAAGQRVYFTPELPGLCTKRKVSDVVLRMGVFLYVIVGLGSRKTSWLMEVLFQVTVSKSSLDRWVDEVADSLPSSEEMIKLLHQQLPITQGHLDELFPLGAQACVLALKDEHGRIIVAKEVEKRDEEHVKPFLEDLKSSDSISKLFTLTIGRLTSTPSAPFFRMPKFNTTTFTSCKISGARFRMNSAVIAVISKIARKRPGLNGTPKTSSAWLPNCGRIVTSSSKPMRIFRPKRKRRCKRFSGRNRRFHSCAASC